MKYLTLIRHAKSSHKEAGRSDIDRTLNDRGRHDAEMMGGILAEILPIPDAVLASPARRVAETLERLYAGASKRNSDSGAGDRRYPDPERLEGLYLAEADEIWDFAYSALLEYDDVWVCGHNPAITEAVALLAGVSLENVPTMGVARIAFEEVLPTGAVGELYFFDVPKNHQS